MVDIHLLFWSVGYPKEQLDVTHSEILEMNEGTTIYAYLLLRNHSMWHHIFKWPKNATFQIDSCQTLRELVKHVMWKSKFGWWKKVKKTWNPFKALHCSNAIAQMQMPMPMPLHTPHLAFHVLADIGPANGCNSSGVPRASVGPANSHCNLAQCWPSQQPSQWHSQEPALAQPTATLSMVRDIFWNGSLVSTQFRDAGDLEHPQHVTLALLFCTRHFMLLCNWAMIGEILLVYHNLIMIHWPSLLQHVIWQGVRVRCECHSWSLFGSRCCQLLCECMLIICV